MLSWIVQTFFSSLWGIIGTTALIVIACGVVAWFVPPLRKLALMVGGVVLAAASIYTKGNRDEARKWKEAEDRAVDKGNNARRDAERESAAGRLRDNEFDRDKG